MDTEGIDLTENTIVDVTATLSLEDGSNYSLQAIGGELRIREADTTPTLADPAAAIRPYEFFPLQQGSKNVYVWTIDAGARLVVYDAV